MSWEVRTMPSKTWSFNRGIAANYLKRFWPLWGAWLAGLLLAAVSLAQAGISSFGPDSTYNVWNFGVMLLNTSELFVMGTAGIAVLAAMAMFHYLYQPRGCGMMHALPLRRESLFVTAFLTGLVPLLCAELLVTLIGMAMTLPGHYALAVSWLQWFGVLALGTVAFYGFAVFCAMLTGHWLVLPAVYAVLNLTAVVVESTGRDLLSLFVYGMRIPRGLKLGFLSPLYQLAITLNCKTIVAAAERIDGTGAVNVYEVANGYTLEGFGWLTVYAVAGLLLAACALLLYRRRRLETAGDVVAIAVLRPVFKYCLSLGTALVFADLLLAMVFHQPRGGYGMAALVLGLMLLGAFIGYFAAKMLMQKTLKVFRARAFRGFAAVCAVLCLFVGLNEFDAFGYERRVPAADEVDYITVLNAKIDEPETVSALIELHRAAIADKARQERGYREGALNVMTFELSYTLKNGGTLERLYLVCTNADELADPDSLGWQLERCYNLPEFLRERVTTAIPVTAQHVQYATLDVQQPRIDGAWQPSLSVTLTGEEAEALYAEGILPDAEALHIGHRWYMDPDGSRGLDATTNVTLNMLLVGDRPEEHTWLDIPVETVSENTIRWLEENKGLTVVAMEELATIQSPIALPGSQN